MVQFHSLDELNQEAEQPEALLINWSLFKALLP